MWVLLRNRLTVTKDLAILPVEIIPQRSSKGFGLDAMSVLLRGGKYKISSGCEKNRSQRFPCYPEWPTVRWGGRRDHGYGDGRKDQIRYADIDQIVLFGLPIREE